MSKPRSGKSYDVADAECPLGHKVTIGWIDSEQTFCFVCEECYQCSNVAAAYDAKGNVRKCIIMERQQ